jgi:hypothetical protein
MNRLFVWALSVFLVICLVPVMAQQPTTALYRWYNSNTGDHFYTTDPSGEAAPNSGYVSEGITGYIKTSQAPGTAALYRWYNSGNGDHFYTTNPQGESAPGYVFETTTGYIATSKITETTELYRWYNSNTGDHFYTTDPQGELAQKAGYTFEGVIGYIWTTAPKNIPTPATNIALYRWYNSEYGYHFYATDLNEVAPFNGWVPEGIIGYIKSSQAPGTTALYHWYNSDTGNDFYTTDPNGEGAPGYVSKGIIGYIGLSQMQGTTALYRWYNSDTGDHFYTTDPQGEAASGYVFEGVIGYIWTKG